MSHSSTIGAALAAILSLGATGLAGSIDSDPSGSSTAPFTLSLSPDQAPDRGRTAPAGPPLHIASPEGVVGGSDHSDHLVRPVQLAETTAPRAPLMGFLSDVHVADALDAARLNIYGHIEGSYSALIGARQPAFTTGHYDFGDNDREADFGIVDRLFDYRQDNKAQINRIDLNFERLVEVTPHDWDYGYRVEFMYGTDARFIHANGWQYSGNVRSTSVETGPVSGKSPFDGPEYQYDLTQAYFDVGIPIGNGGRFRAGKFIFFLNLDPNQSIFYSHSIWWTAALPYTLTGGTFEYVLSKDMDIEVGISRGWNQSLLDNNDAPDYFFRFTKDFSPQTSLTLAAITGPEFQKSVTLHGARGRAISTTNSPDRSHYLTAVEVNFSHKISDQLTVYLDGVFGHKARTPNLGTGSLNFTVIDNEQIAESNWYGVTGQAQYELDPHLYLGGRLEWYRDEEGFTIGNDVAPQFHSESTIGNTSYYEETLGLTILPFPQDALGSNLKIRPEFRFDQATHAVFDGRYTQFTFAVDAIFNF